MARRSILVDSGGGLPVAPLIDVVLLLLIFFMLVSRYLPPSLSVTLPEASAARVTDLPAVMISIEHDGRLVVDGQPSDWGSLSHILAGRDAETQVRIAADKTVDYDYIVRALDAAAQAGLTHIALETQDKRQ
ncbi:biopolymer transporter ExbD [bacterium]|nr:biopolymer transporter ExbD [bacterium]